MKKETKVYDFIVVGQGLAGTMMVHFLLERTDNILVVDAEKHCASFAAAGIINPVTGRNFVKSWMIDVLLPFAEDTYKTIGKKLGITCYDQLNILRTLHSVQEENDWLARLEDKTYQTYLSPHSDASCLSNVVKKSYAYGEIQYSLRIRLKETILTYRKWLMEHDSYLKLEISNEDITHHEDYVQVKELRARNIIFCEGYKAMHNPLFSALPFKPAKGNALIIKSDMALPKNLRDKIFITPIGQGHYWVGSGYQFDIDNELPDEKQIAELKAILDEILAQPYEIVDIVVGIRPTVKTRKPLIGRHHDYKNVYLFNGLGTKGSSLAPYFADMLVRHIFDGAEILGDVAIVASDER